jgi:hypothetical protein
MRKPKPTKKRRRPGAGRKPLGKKRVTYKLMPETIELVKKASGMARSSQSEYVETAVRQRLEADGLRSSANKKRNLTINHSYA